MKTYKSLQEEIQGVSKEARWQNLDLSFNKYEKASAIMTGRSINEDAQYNFLDNVDLNAASKNINDFTKKLIKVDPNLKVSKRKGRTGEVLTITSDNLAGKMSPKMFASLTVDDFNSNFIAGTSRTPASWIFNIHYSWKVFEGGTNGTSIAIVQIDVDGRVIDSSSVVR